MTEHEIGRLIYLLILLVAIGGSYLVSMRANLGKSFRALVIWALLFLGVAAGYSLWNDVFGDGPARQTVFTDSGQIEVPQSYDGHYYLTVDVNGQAIEFVVDTGATSVVLSMADAKRIGIDPSDLRFVGSASTANGTVRTAPVRLSSFTVGPFEDKGVRAWVNEGELETSLLGMSYLQNFEAVTFRKGTLILER